MESCIGQVADPDGQVETIGSKIQRMIADFKLHLDFRITRVKRSEGRADIASAKTQGSIDPYQTFGCGAAAADHLLHLIDLSEDALGVAEIHLTFSRQAHRAGGAVDQSNAQACFKRTQALAHRRWRYSQFTGCCCQAAFLGQEMKKIDRGSDSLVTQS